MHTKNRKMFLTFQRIALDVLFTVRMRLSLIFILNQVRGCAGVPTNLEKLPENPYF